MEEHFLALQEVIFVSLQEALQQIVGLALGAGHPACQNLPKRMHQPPSVGWIWPPPVKIEHCSS